MAGVEEIREGDCVVALTEETVWFQSLRMRTFRNGLIDPLCVRSVILRIG